MPEEKNRFKVARGARVEVGVSADAEETRRPLKPEEVSGGVVSSQDYEEDPLQRRLKGQVSFFDLGTRLNPDGTYRVSAPDPFVVNRFDDYAEELTARMTVALLGGDPFGVTEQAHNAQPNRMRLRLASQWLYVDAVFSKEGEEDARFILGELETRPFVKDYPPEGDAMPPPVAESDARGGWRAGGRLELKSPGEWSLAVESGWYYLPFSSNPDEYKITKEPDAEAEAVEFKYKSGKSARVFLVPRTLLRGGYTSPEETHIDFRWMRLLSTPAPAPFSGVHVAEDALTLRGDTTPEAWMNLKAYWGAYWSSPWLVIALDPETGELVFINLLDNLFDGSEFASDAPASTSLAAVVETGGDKYYFWSLSPSAARAWSRAPLRPLA
jgi:hypothetical protein